MAKLPIALLGATGLVGKQYKELLRDHPFFEIGFELKGHLSRDRLDEIEKRCQLVFSALPTDVAKEYEHLLAEKGLPLFSVASHHRLEKDVPILIPEINPDHLGVIPLQQKERGWKKGYLVVKPNCTVQSYLLPLFPLHRAFTLTKVMVTTMQSTSGAGKGYALSENVIPFIEGEEEKSEREPLKIFGRVTRKGIESAREIALSTQCNRVPVPFGHLTSISVAFRKKPTREEVLDVWKHFRALPQELNLPSAPKNPVIYLEKCNRPQPQLDLHHGAGMSVTVGRLKECPVLDFRFVALSHNLIRGAAGGGVLCAELAYQKGLL